MNQRDERLPFSSGRDAWMYLAQIVATLIVWSVALFLVISQKTGVGFGIGMLAAFLSLWISISRAPRLDLPKTWPRVDMNERERDMDVFLPKHVAAALRDRGLPDFFTWIIYGGVVATVLVAIAINFEEFF